MMLLVGIISTVTTVALYDTLTFLTPNLSHLEKRLVNLYLPLVWHQLSGPGTSHLEDQSLRPSGANWSVSHSGMSWLPCKRRRLPAFVAINKRQSTSLVLIWIVLFVSIKLNKWYHRKPIRPVRFYCIIYNFAFDSCLAGNLRRYLALWRLGKSPHWRRAADVASLDSTCRRLRATNWPEPFGSCHLLEHLVLYPRVVFVAV